MYEFKFSKISVLKNKQSLHICTHTETYMCYNFIIFSFLFPHLCLLLTCVNHTRESMKMEVVATYFNCLVDLPLQLLQAWNRTVPLSVISIWFAEHNNVRGKNGCLIVSRADTARKNDEKLFPGQLSVSKCFMKDHLFIFFYLCLCMTDVCSSKQWFQPNL